MQGEIPLTEEKKMEGESMLTPLQGGLVTYPQRSPTIMIEACGENVTKKWCFTQGAGGQHARTCKPDECDSCKNDV
jgi:hypothetical protein